MASPTISPDSHEMSVLMGLGQTLRVYHIRFARVAEVGDKIRRRFTQPRSMFAVEQAAELGSLPTDHVWPETAGDLYVVCSSIAAGPEVRAAIDRWLAAPDHPEARPPLLIQMDGSTVRWRPGRAFVEGTGDLDKGLLAALIEFSFLEGELRRLEKELLPYETSASEDAEFAYQIKKAGQSQCQRLGEMMPGISRLRLAFARLEPSLHLVSPSLPPVARKTMTRLIAGADVLARLEAFDARLEVCEDLYEGAVDRIADFRWYQNGERLEIAIVILLAVEVILNAYALALHIRW